MRTLQTSHPRTEKPGHPRTKSGHPRTLMLGTSHVGFGWGGGGGTKASLMLGTRVGSMDSKHHLPQPFRVWLGGVV